MKSEEAARNAYGREGEPVCVNGQTNDERQIKGRGRSRNHFTSVLEGPKTHIMPAE
jgi:hypothetical protein